MLDSIKPIAVPDAGVIDSFEKNNEYNKMPKIAFAHTKIIDRQ